MSYSTTDTYQMKREILNSSNKISRKLSKPKNIDLVLAFFL